MSHASDSGDIPTVFLHIDSLGLHLILPDGTLLLDIDLQDRQELRELASVVNLGLIYRGSLAKTRSALRAAGLYDLFGDLMLASDLSEIPRILHLLGGPKRPEPVIVVGTRREVGGGLEALRYLPDSSLLYGELAGEALILASIEWRGPLSSEHVRRLQRSSVAPLIRHSNPEREGILAYLCEGSRAPLEGAGFDVIELANHEVVDTTELYVQYLSSNGYQTLDQFEIFANDRIRALAIPLQHRQAVETAGADAPRYVAPDPHLLTDLP